MKKADSIVIRLTGMVFILIFLTIAILLILVNNQMDSHFSQYLNNMSQMMGNGHQGMGMMHGGNYVYIGCSPVAAVGRPGHAGRQRHHQLLHCPGNHAAFVGPD